MLRSLLIPVFVLCCLWSNAAIAAPEKTPLHPITITIDAGGNVFMGPDTIYVDKLAGDLQQRLWKSWLSTGKMYDSIIIIFRGEVLMGVKGAALDAIKEAQDKTLIAVCLQKYKKTFESLTDSQKKKLKRQFPAIFQELHW